MHPAARSYEERKRDTLDRLENDIDCWIATASEGNPYLIPLSFLWEEGAIWLSTVTNSPTSRNLARGGDIHLGFGLVRDVILMQGRVEITLATNIDPALGNRFASKTGFDPRDDAAQYTYFKVTPRRILAWREVNELRDRELMREGSWKN